MDTNKRMLGNWLLMALGLLGLVVSVPAVAQNLGAPSTDIQQYLGSTPSGDMSMMLWRSVLGSFASEPFSAIGGPDQTALGMLFIFFNAAIFAVGMIRLTYGVGGAIIGTANEGEALGKNMNTAWYPIRVITGVSGMIPVLGGFTLSQGALMWTATLGIGIANTLFNASIDGVRNGVINLGLYGNSAVATSSIDSKALMLNLIRMGLCVEGSRRQALVAEKGYQIPVDPNQVMRMSPPTVDGDTVYVEAGSALAPAACGKVVLVKRDAPRESSSAVGFRVESVNYKGIADASMEAHRIALGELAEYAQRLAGEWAVIRDNVDPEVINARRIDDVVLNNSSVAAARLQQRIVEIFKGLDFNAVQDQAAANMKRSGWMSMGGWFSTYAEVNAAIASAFSSVTFQYVPHKEYQIQVYPKSVELLKSFELKLGSDVQRRGGTDEAWSFKSLWCPETPTGNCSLGQKIVEKAIGATAVGSGGGNDELALVNPIISQKNVGDYLMTISATVMGADIAAGLFPNGASKVGKVLPDSLIGKMASGLAESLQKIAYLLFAVGAYMALYTPMIPFIIWVGALIAYAASFIEGLVAMPLHSFSHLETQGDGMGQSTTHGYLFFLNTLVRPAIMVMSFIIATGLMIGLGTFATHMFIPAMANAQGNSITGLLSIVGYLVIYGVIMSTLITACFELIKVVPDQVIGFVGSGNISTHLGREIEGKMSSMFLAAGRFGSAIKTPGGAVGVKNGTPLAKPVGGKK